MATRCAIGMLALFGFVAPATAHGQDRSLTALPVRATTASIESLATQRLERLFTPQADPQRDRWAASVRGGNAAPQAAGNTGSRRRSVTRIVFGSIVGGFAGFFAGGYTGAWIEGDRCHCDDPGLKGALIGAPIGAATGAILGGRYLF